MVILGGLELVAAGIIFNDYQKEKRRENTKHELQDWERRQRRHQRHENKASNRPQHPLQQPSLIPPSQPHPPRPQSAPPPNWASAAPQQYNPQPPLGQWQPPPRQGYAPPMWQQPQPQQKPNPYNYPPQPPQGAYSAAQPQWQPQPAAPAFSGYPPQNPHPSTFNRDPDAKNPNLYHPSPTPPHAATVPYQGAQQSPLNVPNPPPGVVEMPAEPVTRPSGSQFNPRLDSGRYHGPPSSRSSHSGSENIGERPDPPPAYSAF